MKGVGKLFSGAACCFTEVETLVSTGLDAAMAVDDTKQAIDATPKQQAEEQNQQQQKPVEKGVWDKFTDWSTDNTNIGQINFCPFSISRKNLVLNSPSSGRTLTVLSVLAKT